ncbi:MAG: elongation factor P maturation arginine rhamnosyltransferase EarP [Casimicrobiaceae bacterium]
MASTTHPARWDIFCSVVDNYGDIGVAWRLARQLAAEHRLDVRLYIDALAALSRIAPEVDASAGRQSVLGVDVRAWDRWRDARLADDDMGQVVVEAFGCGLAPGYVAAMSSRTPLPVWINLEYLTAEGWIEGYHGLPSPQARGPLTRYFYFPGFTAASGGLLRELGLFARRDVFRADNAARAKLWRTLQIAPPPVDALAVSLFCYADAPVAQLFDAWSAGDSAVCCLIPESVANTAVKQWAGRNLRSGEAHRRGALMLLPVPFVAQDDYDRLLWSCDLNFVRGEDSFVRAQWAARPLLWQPYRQSEDAHLGKLEAFLGRHSAGLSPDAGTVFAAFNRGWCTGSIEPSQWDAVAAAYPELSARADAWAADLAAQDDLAARLVNFAFDRV